MADDDRRWRIRSFHIVGSGHSRTGIPDHIEGPDTEGEYVEVIDPSEVAAELDARARTAGAQGDSLNDDYFRGRSDAFEAAASLLRDCAGDGLNGGGKVDGREGSRPSPSSAESELSQVIRQVLDRSSEESEGDQTLPRWSQNWLEDALRHSQL